ncbi:MAG: hypothetical protein J5825_06500 [Lachnospiraceae bacterium]|nr:hypothetical protein [Lachnospiraceae bacterium]
MRKRTLAILALVCCLGFGGCTGGNQTEETTAGRTEPAGKQESVTGSESATEQQTEKPTEEQTEGQTEEKSEEQTEGQTEQKSEKQTEGQTEEQTESQTESLSEETTPEDDGEGVALSEKNFPDEVFRNYLLKEADMDQNGRLDPAEVQMCTFLYLPESGIKSLKGVEYLTELSSLNFSNNEITELDISANKALIGLVCYKTPLKSLDLSGQSNNEFKLLCDPELTVTGAGDLAQITRFYETAPEKDGIYVYSTSYLNVSDTPKMKIEDGKLKVWGTLIGGVYVETSADGLPGGPVFNGDHYNGIPMTLPLGEGFLEDYVQTYGDDEIRLGMGIIITLKDGAVTKIQYTM